VATGYFHIQPEWFVRNSREANRIRSSSEIMTSKPSADKLVASKNTAHPNQQFTSRVSLDDVAMCARTKGFPHHIGRRFWLTNSTLDLGESLRICRATVNSV